MWHISPKHAQQGGLARTAWPKEKMDRHVAVKKVTKSGSFVHNLAPLCQFNETGGPRNKYGSHIRTVKEVKEVKDEELGR
jgi:hypothetical protein